MQAPDVDPPGERPGRDDYEPPHIELLGTLAELTRGGIIGPEDGFGGAGDSGIT